MNQEITALVFRFDPDQDREPRFEEYRIRVEEEVSVLVLLDRIQKEIDPTLSFRSYCCGLQMCGSCLMKIDQKKRFACITLIRPGGKVMIEPASFPEGHIKDLVVKVEAEE